MFDTFNIKHKAHLLLYLGQVEWHFSWDLCTQAVISWGILAYIKAYNK